MLLYEYISCIRRIYDLVHWIQNYRYYQMCSICILCPDTWPPLLQQEGRLLSKSGPQDVLPMQLIELQSIKLKSRLKEWLLDNYVRLLTGWGFEGCPCRLSQCILFVYYFHFVQLWRCLSRLLEIDLERDNKVWAVKRMIRPRMIGSWLYFLHILFPHVLLPEQTTVITRSSDPE